MLKRVPLQALIVREDFEKKASDLMQHRSHFGHRVRGVLGCKDAKLNPGKLRDRGRGEDARRLQLLKIMSIVRREARQESSL